MKKITYIDKFCELHPDIVEEFGGKENFIKDHGCPNNRFDMTNSGEGVLFCWGFCKKGRLECEKCWSRIYKGEKER